MYKVIGRASSRAARVLWILEELGLEYEHLPEEPRSQVVLAHNPTGKVPVLLVGDQALTDSTAILTHLADVNGKLTYPAGSIERALQDGFTQQILDEMEGPLWTAARHSFALPAEHRHPEIKDSLKWEFSRAQGFISERLGTKSYLMGDEFTLADIVLGHCLIWARAAKFPEPTPTLADYMQRISQRPAFQRVFAKPAPKA